MRSARQVLLVSCVLWGLLSALPLDNDDENLSVIPLPTVTHKDKPPSFTSQPGLSREERHRQIDVLRANRDELGDVVDQWFRSRWSASEPEKKENA